jgi:hypothetical protein
MRRWLYDPPTKVELEATYDSNHGVPLRWRAVNLEVWDGNEGFTVTDFQLIK